MNNFIISILLIYISFTSGIPVSKENVPEYSYQIQKLFRSANLTTNNLLNKIYASSSKNVTRTSTQVISTTKAETITTIKPSSEDTNSIPIDMFFPITTTSTTTNTVPSINSGNNSTKKQGISEKSSSTKLKAITKSNKNTTPANSLPDKSVTTTQTPKQNDSNVTPGAPLSDITPGSPKEIPSSNNFNSNTYKIQSGHIQVRASSESSSPSQSLQHPLQSPHYNKPPKSRDVSSDHSQCVLNVIPNEHQKKSEHILKNFKDSHSPTSLITKNTLEKDSFKRTEPEKEISTPEASTATATTVTTITSKTTTTETAATAATTMTTLESQNAGQITETDSTTPPLTDKDFYTMVTDALLVVVSEKLTSIGSLSVELKPGLVFIIGSLGYISRGGPITLRHAKEGRQRVIETSIMIGPLTIGPEDHQNAGQNTFKFYIKGDMEIRLKRNMQREIVVHLSELEIGATEDQIYLIDGVKRVATSATYGLIQDFLTQISFEELVSDLVKNALSLESIHQTFTAIPEFLPLK